MRTFRRDFPEYATGLFTETEGKDMTSATAQIGLSSDRATPPTTWEAPDATSRPTVSTIRVSKLIDTDVAIGTYWLWIKVTDSPEVLPRVAGNSSFIVK